MEKAVRELGCKAAPPINHSTGCRVVETGWHSNGVESEAARLKCGFAGVMASAPRPIQLRSAQAHVHDELCVDVGDTVLKALVGGVAAFILRRAHMGRTTLWEIARKNIKVDA